MTYLLVCIVFHKYPFVRDVKHICHQFLSLRTRILQNLYPTLFKIDTDLLFLFHYCLTRMSHPKILCTKNQSANLKGYINEVERIHSQYNIVLQSVLQHFYISTNSAVESLRLVRVKVRKTVKLQNRIF